MMSAIYCILLSLCFYDIFALAEEIECRIAEDIEIYSSDGNNELILQNATVKFKYDTEIERYTNRSTSSIRSALFTALTKQQENQPSTKTIVKFSTIKELRAASDIANHDETDERRYCSVTLLQEPSTRVGVRKIVEVAMRKTLLPCLQDKLCESSDTIGAKGVVQKMKYRRDSAIARKKLQDSINSISDLVVGRLVRSLTSETAKIPAFSDGLPYPTGGLIFYTVFEGSFFNTAKVERLEDTRLTENNDKVEVVIVYRLRDINVKFSCKLRGRISDPPGNIEVNVTRVTLNAKLTFDYTTCQANLESADTSKMGDFDYKISKALWFYEKPFTGAQWNAVDTSLKKHMARVIKQMVNKKFEEFKCGTLKSLLKREGDMNE